MPTKAISKSFDDNTNIENVSISVGVKNCLDPAAALSGAVNENEHSGLDASEDEDHESIEEDLEEATPTKSKKRGVSSYTRREAKNCDGIGVFVHRKLMHAFENPVVFDNFSVADNLSSIREGKQPITVTPPAHTTYWDGSVPKVGVDRDGIPIVVYIPSLFSDVDNAHVCESMCDFYETNKSNVQPKATGSNARNQLSNFLQDNGDSGSDSPMIGVIELGILVEQGHSNQKPRASAANFGTTVTSTSERSTLNKTFSFCRTAENIALSFIDPEWYGALGKIREGLKHSNPVNEMVQKVDPSYWPSHTVTWNRHIHLHFDKKDHFRGWASLSVYGTFKSGGDLCIPALGLRIAFKPKDHVSIRGRMLEHSISPFQGGDRFAHTSYLPLSIFSHFEHLVHKPLSLLHPTDAHDILLSLVEHSHRVWRTKLNSRFNLPKPKKRSGRRISLVQFKTERNKVIYGEKKRRDDSRLGKQKAKQPNKKKLVE